MIHLVFLTKVLMTEIDRESMTPFMNLKGKSAVDIKEVSFFTRMGTIVLQSSVKIFG